MKLPALEDLCGMCRHAYKFHVDRYGTIQPCDFELIGALDARPEGEPVLCDCGQFEQVADPEEALVSRCSICGEEGGGHGRGCVLYDDVDS